MTKFSGAGPSKASRREFLKRSAALTAFTSAGGAILQACTVAETPGSTQGQATQAQATPKPVKGGHYTDTGNSATTTHLNPLLSGAPNIVATMYDSLLQYRGDADARLVPQLAQSLPKVSGDGLTYTFELRKDITWTDGRPLTADDVVFTYRLMYHPDYKAFPAPTRADMEALIADILAPDPYTVVMKTTVVNAPFLALHSRYGILPKHVFGNVAAAELKNHPAFRNPTVTSGPFKFKEWVLGDHVTVVRNDDCYRGAPYLDSYILREFPAQANIVTAVLAGEVDSMTIYFFGRYDEFKVSPVVNATFFATGVGARIAYNMDPTVPASKVFSSKAVRQALLYAADRDGAARAILFGYGDPPSGVGVWWKGNWADNPDVKPRYPYDPKKAEELLDADGWRKGASGIREKNGVPMKFELITSSNNDTWKQTAAIFQESWKKIGIDVSVRPLEYVQATNAALAHEFDLIVYQTQYLNPGGDPDPTTAYHSRNAVKNIGRNYSSYKNPEVDKLLEEATLTLDQQKRKDLYFKVQDILNEDVPMFATWHWHTAWVCNKRVRGAEEQGPYTYGSRSFINEWWVTDGK